MRKLGLLAAAAGLALSGSMAKADFTISATAPIAGPTIGTQTTQIYDFSVSNNGNDASGSGIKSMDIALYSSLGMYINVRSGGNAGIPDVFFQSNTSTNDSWISDQAFHAAGSPEFPGNGNNGALAGINQTVLPLGQSPSTGTGVLSNTFSANQLVQGIAGTLQTTGTGDASPLYFARVVVPTGALVQLLAPGGTNLTPVASTRTWEPSSGVFSSGNGLSFAATNSNGVSGPFSVPEPSSVALLGIGAAGLVSRRRRMA